jgi:sulfatase maturation enzyme AslB (radical SAM superfamily)
MYLRGEKGSNIRARILKETDCKECVWWEKCYGGCPAQAIDSDWRNKDRYCLVYKSIFKRIVNSFKFLGVPEPKKKEKKTNEKGENYLDYYDGIEHQDGDTRYLDSDMRWGK